ncbi:alpha,alpha-trehalose-phosphate synthase (UDP-forming) [Halovivax gelatinilyticus]|uniref:alpha,alpha-trehalose-phosphate synthase (UDP-forming) n=1 Tax=Halovivax gelatinilyticus TaxID=2961597 RepID=UPI0020CA4E15|nr:trehalose-6-phosphate synthase [Halovivax gelatinilyticus]
MERSRNALEEFDSLVLVSNRQPYRHRWGDGDVVVDQPTGGLTAALDPVLQRVGGTWIAWGDGDADRTVVDDRNCVRVPPDDPSYTLRRVWLDEDTVDAYYEGFSNRVLWPLCHEFPEKVVSRVGDFEGYEAVNERFADCAAEHVDGETLIWLQDYHLALTPAGIDDRTPESTTIGQFWHIPWPTPDTFGVCPRSTELVDGLLGVDLLSFHVDRYVENFLDSVERFRPDATVEKEAGRITHERGETYVTATPLGIDADRHARESYAIAEGRHGRSGSDAFDELGDERPAASATDCLDIPDCDVLCLGVDRLDYSKGIPARIEAVERLLERHPEWRESLVFVQTATPSRTTIPAYAEHGERVRQAVDRVNDRFRTDDWEPIVYTESYLARPVLVDLYRRADLMLVTPHLDGMNLVSKEFVASSIDNTGALCLSEHAGASSQLGDLAYTVDPSDPDGISDTIHEALTACQAEQSSRMRRLRQRVHERDIDWWMAQQFETLRWVATRPQLSVTGPNAGDG